MKNGPRYKRSHGQGNRWSVGKFECKACGVRCYTVKGLNLHRRARHADFRDEATYDEEELQAKVEPAEIEPISKENGERSRKRRGSGHLECLTCGARVCNVKGLNRHRREQHSDFRNNATYEKEARRGEKAEQSMKSEPISDKCGDGSRRGKHRSNKLGSYSCICGAKYQTLARLNMHRRIYHSAVTVPKVEAGSIIT